MRILKYLLYLIIALLLIWLILCLVGPKNMKASESTSIEAPPNMVYNLVNNLESWEKWSPWNALDTAMAITYSDKTEGVGASYSWDGPKNGTGTLEIVESTLGEAIKTQMQFGGFDGYSHGTWSFDKQDDGNTNVTWGFNGSDIPFFFRPMAMMGAGQLKKAFVQGLSNLKGVAEERAKNNVYRGHKVNRVDVPARHFVMNRQEVDIANIQQFYTQNLGALFGKVQRAGVEMDGMPCGLFFKWDPANGKTDMAAAIPVKEAVDIRGASSHSVDARPALQIDYYGDYSGTESAHYAIDDYMKDYGLLNDVPVIEEYVTDPSTEKDPSKWLTKITYYIAQ